MRRTTLGTMNIGNKGRIPPKDKSVARPRSSIGVSGIPSAAASRLSTSRPRTSFGSSRRSSQYGRDSYSQVKDPRPLSDKGYQQREIKDIIEFLSSYDYDHPISVKVLNSPTSKEFLKVFVFIYKFLDPELTYQKIITKKPEEEVPKILKSLGYPFTIHKTALANVGSPHAWPVLLGALHWMLTLVKFGFRVGEDVDQYLFPLGDEEEDFGAIAEAKVFSEYLEKTYIAFLDGLELENLAQSDYYAAFEEEIKSKNQLIISEVGKQGQENTQLEKELLELQNKPSELERLMEKKTSLEGDRAKFETYISDLRRHKSKLEERSVQSEEALNLLKLEQEATAAEKIKVQKVLDKQDLSPADVQRMKKEKDELRKMLDKLEEQKDKLDQESWEIEMAYAKRHEQSLAFLEQYNEEARKLKLIPKTAENAAGADYELKCHLGKMSLDFQNDLKPNLLRFKQQISESTRSFQCELFALGQKHDELLEQISEKDEDICTAEKDLAAMEKEYDWKKEICDQEYKKLSEKAEKMQEELQTMRQNARVGVKEKQKEVEDLKNRLQNRSEEMDRERTQYEMFLRAVCDEIIDHKTKIQNRVAEVRKDAEEFLKYMQDLPVVTSELLAEKDEQQK